jgi:hypothetical protein
MGYIMILLLIVDKVKNSYLDASNGRLNNAVMRYSKEDQKRRFLNFLLQEFCGSYCCTSEKAYFEICFFEETFYKTRI